MRSIDLLVKLARHDIADIPAYGYTLQKPPTPRAINPKPLPRSTPEAQGVSSTAVERLFSELESSSALAPHCLMLLRHGKVIAEGGFAPYRTDMPHMLYSMSKSITGTAIGMAIDEGLMSLEDKLIDIFSDVTGAIASKTLKNLTIRHLLTMSTGSRFNEIGSMLEANWARMFMETLPKFDAGTAFDYNSMNTYMLAAALVRKSGKSLVNYLKPRLFDPLHIEEYTWETCPRGIEKGGWGLSLKIEDAAKIGQLYLQNGEWDGKQLVSREWVKEAIRSQIATPCGECKDGYGYQIWLNGKDAYQFNGAFGQYVIVMPRYDAVIALFSGSAKLFAEGTLNSLVRACFFSAGDALAPNPSALASLERKLAMLRHPSGFAHNNLEADSKEFLHICDLLCGREYRLSNNTGGLFPLGLQAVHGNYTPGADLLRFEITQHGLTLTMYEGTQRNTITVRQDGSYVEQTVCMHGEQQCVATRGEWRLTAAGIQLAIFASFIETPNTRVIFLELKNEKLSVTFYEYPALDACVEMLFELVGYSKAAFFRRLTPALQNIPTFSGEKFSDVLRRFTIPAALGSLIKRN